MSFLRSPRRRDDESDQGYLHRLASENALSFRQASSIARDGGGRPDANEAQRAGNSQAVLSMWCSRFCPACLSDSQHWRRAWEVPFADACTTHGTWLVDVCGACGDELTWTRPSLLECNCGSPLAGQASGAAPEAVVALSRDLHDLAAGRPASRLAPLHGLSLPQAVRLVRLLGTYGSAPGRLPQKVLRVDRMAVSWPIASYAAEVLSAWPQGFERMLEALRSGNAEGAQGSLPRSFRGMYVALYRGLRDPQFEFVRAAFEAYVQRHWTASLARRNRRLAPAAVEAAAWVSAKEAAARLGVSTRRVRELIATGALDGTHRMTRGGRTFWVVRKRSIEGADTLEGSCTLQEAAQRLGLKRARLARLVGPLSPLGADREAYFAAWRIDPSVVACLELIVLAAPVAGDTQSQAVTFDQVLRHWALPDATIGRLLVELIEGSLEPVGRVSDLAGVPSLLLPLSRLAECRKRPVTVSVGLTVPEVARVLAIKQEVAYFLIRRGLLAADRVRGARRPEWRVSREQLADFQRDYVFAREIAARRAVSPRSTMAWLAAVGRRPCSGPGVDGGRQALYRRSDLAEVELPLDGGR